MKNKIIIQKSNSDNLPINIDSFSAYLGFMSLNYNVELLSYEDLLTKDMSGTDIFAGYGHINFVNQLLKISNLKYPFHTDYPLGLINYRKRIIKRITIKEFQKEIEKSLNENPLEILEHPVFVKPVKMKQFHTGLIYNKSDYTIWKSLNEGKFESNDEIYVSDIIKNLVSEYRCYIYNDKIVDAKCYQGNFKIHPDWNTLSYMISDFKNSPKAYGLDVGICYDFNLDKYYTILIEVNPMYSLGNYGIDNELFSNMILSAWNELLPIDIKQ